MDDRPEKNDTERPLVDPCDKCGKPAKLVSGSVVYPSRHDLYGRKFWACVPCNRRIGCHPGTDKPLGRRMAGPRTREARLKAHTAFDRLWKRGYLTRNEAYAWLAKVMRMPRKDCHIGQMSAAQCRAVVLHVQALDEQTRHRRG